MLTITLIILLLTCVISFSAFSNEKVINDLIFYPTAITNHNQWYRFITCGFIHADFMHLAFNMYTFYLFGGMVEEAFTMIYGEMGKALYIIMYLTSLVVCLLPTYFAHRNNYYYRSLGASGAVSAVIFIGIFLNPTMGMGIFPIPFHIPAFIFGPLYLGISAYLAKKGHGNINHSAHIWGAVYGIVFLAVTSQFLTEFRPVGRFVEEVTNYFR
ncbi:MAG: rhomboid family intramembrane serine protease [Chitinophagaceae bacterium]|nr:rhomboid family intramembrane serine protease [Chitinophagaceae bacterium]MEA3426458.1 rhomboid family intramembrane serine protease [Bacteroidota bacterium]MCA6452186.1 rhomboid family intramembrane serine protease [Chitinophagaceae bacterium]MCA6454854.1 rhomboid family intramembrane serine protease [Chitinophagaceae bacterium]MCA6458470.1 rhomboid family intramembrane serine protease [Chitinophagaceae bacterium]